MKKKAIRVVAIALLVALVLAAFTGCSKKEEPKPTEQSSEESGDAESDDAESSEKDKEDKSGESHVASGDDTIEATEVVEEGMVPVYAKDIKPGTYPVEMVSSSSMFKADHCELIVEEDSMQVVLYMTSEAYLYMFAGTGEEADKAAESEYILPEEIGDGMRTFTLPLEALDDGEFFAAFSKKKELWYDRTLLFRVDSLPREAFVDGFFVTAESLGLAEGEYTVEVALAGGSGRASVESPTKLVVNAEGIFAEIVWSSSNYDYMRVGQEKFLPINEEGNSTFMIPVEYFDRAMKVAADTTAMSEPHEIDYTLTFDSASIKVAE